MTERPDAILLAAEPLSVASATGAWDGRIAVLSASVPRDQVTVPICLTRPPSDEQLFDDPVDPASKYWLPRYRLAEELVSGRPRYQLGFAEKDGSWRLTARLVPVPPPTLDMQALGHPMLPHELGIQLSYAVLGAPATRKALVFQELIRSDEAVDATLILTSLAQFGEVFQALREVARDARLTIRRKATVAVQEKSGISGQSPTEAGVMLGPGRIPLQQIGPAQPLRPIGPLRPGDPIEPLEPLRPIRPIRPLRPIGPTIPPRPAMPAPQLSFLRSERSVIRGTEFVRFYLSVDNWEAFQPELFAPAPTLPPCGANTNAARSWVDIIDGATDARVYGFCALGQPNDLTRLWFARQVGTPIPQRVRVRIVDRLTGTAQDSNAVTVQEGPPPEPDFRIVEAVLDQIAEPEPFTFSPDLHGYIFDGVGDGGGGPTPERGLIRRQESFGGTVHSYFQDPVERERVLFLPDDFRIARNVGEFRPPIITLHVHTIDGSAKDATATLDIAVAPTINPDRLVAARTALATRLRIDPAALVLQPLITSKLRFIVQRPTAAGKLDEQRPANSLMLQGPVFDTLAMPLTDFQMAFDAMVGKTASLFGGRVEIDIEGLETEILPFVVAATKFAGPLLDITATETGGGLTVALRNAIESPVRLQNPTFRAVRGGASADVAATGGAALLPGAAAEFGAVLPALPGAGAIELELRSGATVVPDDAALLNAILDRKTLEYYREITVETVPSVFHPIPERPDDQILAILVDFDGGASVQLRAEATKVVARIDYPFDDVILGRPVSSTYRYRKTVVRVDGRQQPDAESTPGDTNLLFLSVVK